jgi:hypothetical protein
VRIGYDGVPVKPLIRLAESAQGATKEDRSKKTGFTHAVILAFEFTKSAPKAGAFIYNFAVNRY